MQNFITRLADRIMGVISGFDRIPFRGRMQRAAYPEGLEHYLSSEKVLLKEFGDIAKATTARVKARAYALTAKHDRPVIYLQSSEVRKEDVANRILAEKPVKDGLACVISCVEPAQTFEVHRS